MRALFLTLLLLLPALAQSPKVDFMLRVGDFADAAAAGDDSVYLAWGTGRWEQAIDRGLVEADRHGPDELALRLLVLSAAQSSGRLAPIRGQLEQVHRLSARQPGARGQLQRFLAASYQAEQDFRDQDLSPEVTSQRARQAFATLEALSVDDDLIARGQVELPLAAEEVAFWIQHDPQTAIPLYQATLEPLLKYRPTARWDSLALYYQLMSLSHVATIEAVAASRMDDDQALARLTGLVQRVDAALSEEGKNQNKTCVARGFMAVSSARAHRQLADLVLRRRPLQASAVEAAFVRDHLNAAYEAARRQRSPKVLTGVQTDLLEALWGLRRPGWEATLEEFLQALIPQWEERHERPALIVAYGLQGRLRATQKRNPEAIRALEKALGLLEESIQEADSKALGQRLRHDWGDLYELLARLQLEAGQGQEAAATLDRMRQVDTLATFTLRDLKNPQTREASTLQRRVEGLEAQNADPAVLASTRSQYYAALDRLQRQEPGYRRLSVRPDVLRRLQPSLPEDTLLVQLFPTETRLYLFVATRQSLAIRQVEVRSEELDQAVDRFRREVVVYSRQPAPFDWSAPAGQSLAEPMVTLGQAILAPLAEDLAGKKVVAFVPTGKLSYFPMQALALPGPRFLLQDHPVVVLPKVADLEALVRPTSSEPGSLVALGDPDGSLPAARAEALEVSALFPGSQVWVGPEATAARLQSLGDKTRYLHLATHGILDSTDPTRTYLLMAGNPQQLGVLDVANMEMGNLRLVTLSACQSALADRNPEVGWDLSSLADAFGFAGSPALVASLWKVDDRATGSMMVAFYRNLAAGQSRGQALQQAQLDLLGRPATRHPFYWASFELLGDWR